MSDPIPFANGPAASATPPAPPPMFVRDGFVLSWAIQRGGVATTDALWMLLFGARAVYTADAAIFEQLRVIYGAASWRRITSPNPLAPDVLVIQTVEGLSVYFICGTSNLVQWVQYVLQFGQVAVGAGVGRIFSSFNDVGNGMYAPIAADYDAHGGGKPVLFVGHSLGGALADYIGKRFFTFKQQVTSGVITFGAPRVGDEDYAGWPAVHARQSRPTFGRVFVDKDQVPRLIPSRFVRAPDGDLTGVVKCIPVKYRHTFGWWLSLPDSGSGEIGRGAGDAGSLSDDFASVRLLSAGGAPAAHRSLRYGQLLQDRTGRSQAAIRPDVYSAYQAFAATLAGRGV